MLQLARFCEHSVLPSPLHANSVIVNLDTNRAALARATSEATGCKVDCADHRLCEVRARHPVQTDFNVVIGPLSGRVRLNPIDYEEFSSLI